jgi:exodeoxyribonuclease VII small subunit
VPVSKAAKATNPTSLKVEDIPFEEALKRLESIVETMENQDLPLEALLARFEEGKRLAQLCQTKLAEAELRIQQLEKTTTGELVTKPLELGDQS